MVQTNGFCMAVGIAGALESFKFDTIYGHYFDRVIPTNGKQIFERSAKRYVAAIMRISSKVVVSPPY